MRKGNINNNNNNNKDNLVEDVQKETKSDKAKVITLIVCIIICVLVTTGLLIYKYIQMSGNGLDKNVLEDIFNEEIVKSESLDSKYLVNFKDMYKLNPITIVEKEYRNGSIKVEGETQDKISIQYVQISGLLNNNIQKMINDQIKEAAFKYSDEITDKQQYSSYTDVYGNFNNILSVNTSIYIYEENQMIREEQICLNYNLVTGDKIKFLDLFADNTPINWIIYNVKYEALAWDTEIDFEFSEEEMDKATNMDNRDTSHYEDIILETINKFKRMDKDSIKFYVTPSMLYFILPTGENNKEELYLVKLYKYIDYVTMYKKFETDKNIYQSKPTKSILVFNNTMDFLAKYYKIESDNLFISIFDLSSEKWKLEQDQEYIQKYSEAAVKQKAALEKQLVDETVSKIKKLANKNKDSKGYMARYMIYSDISEYDNGYGEESFITISIQGTLEEMDIAYYNENAFKLLAKNNVGPKVSVDDLLTGYLDYKNSNINVLEDDDGYGLYSTYAYYDLNGKCVATSYEEMMAYLDSKYK